MEVWRIVEECSDYEVSNVGRVRRGSRLRKPNIKNGYPQVALYHGGQPRHRNVHRLVASAFVPNPDGKPCVNHIDGDKTNNRAENLEWVTHAENTRHGLDAGLLTVGSKRYNHKLTEEQVGYIKHSTATLKELANRYGVSITNIWNIRHGRSWKHVT